MSSLIKIGSILEIISQNPVQYKVWLEDNSTVFVSQGKIRPRPARILEKGSSLVVYEVNGDVKWASTDLSYRNSFNDETTKNERKTYTVAAINLNQGIVTFKDDEGSSLRIRLPLETEIWKFLSPGEKIEIESNHAEDGETKHSVIMPSEASKPSSQRQTDEKQKTNFTEFRKDNIPNLSEHPPSGSEGQRFHEGGKNQYGKSEESNIEVGRLGIDPDYFRARQKEDHRFEIMAFLTEHLTDDLIEWYRMKEGRDVQFGQPTHALHPQVVQALKGTDTNYSQLYNHQAKALDAIRKSRNLIVVTQTASGKTLCYNPAIFEDLISKDSSARAMYVFPLNALLMDQKEKIDNLLSAFKERGIVVNAEFLIGGIKSERRKQIANENPQILIINPELLNWILQEPSYWKGFFSNLKYVVIDEVHTYRGILGMHMAGILRRLVLQTNRLGAQPQFILSSATVRNPLDLAQRLTSKSEKSFDLLSEKEDGSRQANKHWLVVNPDMHGNGSGNGYDNYLNTAALTMVELLNAKDQKGNQSPLHTIVFAKSKKDVTKIFQMVKQNMHHNPGLLGRIRMYASSELSTKEKREIYDDLKSGTLIGIVSTNALEAGIDIGHLDACIIAGFPYNVMRMRQMAGRVGRILEGLVIFVPSQLSSLDQFYRQNPMSLLTQEPEVFVVDPGSPYIARKHLNTAAYNLNGLDLEEIKIFGPRVLEMIDAAKTAGVMTENQGRFWGTKRSFNNQTDLYAISSLRSQPQTPYAICTADIKKCNYSQSCLDTNSSLLKCSFRVNLLDKQYVYRDCHPGAIYESMDGQLYKGVDFDDRKRIVQVEPVQESSTERTFAEEDISIQIIGNPRVNKPLRQGIELVYGDVQVTRSFTGYYTYERIPKRRCGRCRKEYDDTSSTACPTCGRRTIRVFSQSKIKRQDFPEPFNEQGFHISLRTVACWMIVPAVIERNVDGAVPCKLPGEQNKVMNFLKNPLRLEKLPTKLNLSKAEKNEITNYYEQAGSLLRSYKKLSNETVLFPGLYGQCLLNDLKQHIPESRSLEIYQALTGYPVTDNLKHICRNCQGSALLPAMHTLEHTVFMRYPSVALGDLSDLGSYTSLGHPSIGAPAIFWYDNYEGGLGAAEKIFEQFQDLLIGSETTLNNCTCNSLEGCPICTQIGQCNIHNETLSKAGGSLLLGLLLGKQVPTSYRPFIYRREQRTKFENDYRSNEYAKREHGIGEEVPKSQKETIDPFQLLRVQREIHNQVLEKAFEVRSQEIFEEAPPVSAVDLNEAFQKIKVLPHPEKWNIRQGMNPYQVLEILPAASLPMAHKIYRVIATKIHPDVNSLDRAQANEMMKLLNSALEQIREERKNNKQE